MNLLIFKAGYILILIQYIAMNTVSASPYKIIALGLECLPLTHNNPHACYNYALFLILQ